MAEHNAAYFKQALQNLDWSHSYTGQQLMNVFSNFPVGWFEKVPPDKTFGSADEFWQYLTPISASTRGPLGPDNSAAEALDAAYEENQSRRMQQ